MHFAAVPQVQIGRQAAPDCNPAYPSRSFCGPYRLSGQLCPQPFLHQFAQGAPQLDSAFLGLDKQIIRQFDGGLFHTGNHNTIIMYETGAGTWLCCRFGNRQGRRGYFAPREASRKATEGLAFVSFGYAQSNSAFSPQPSKLSILN